MPTDHMNSGANSATKYINECNAITCIYKVHIMSDESRLEMSKESFSSIIPFNKFLCNFRKIKIVSFVTVNMYLPFGHL